MCNTLGQFSPLNLSTVLVYIQKHCLVFNATVYFYQKGATSPPPHLCLGFLLISPSISLSLCLPSVRLAWPMRLRARRGWPTRRSSTSATTPTACPTATSSRRASSASSARDRTSCRPTLSPEGEYFLYRFFVDVAH